jgi:hypothetical protein
VNLAPSTAPSGLHTHGTPAPPQSSCSQRLSVCSSQTQRAPQHAGQATLCALQGDAGSGSSSSFVQPSDLRQSRIWVGFGHRHQLPVLAGLRLVLAHSGSCSCYAKRSAGGVSASANGFFPRAMTRRRSVARSPGKLSLLREAGVPTSWDREGAFLHHDWNFAGGCSHSPLVF